MVDFQSRDTDRGRGTDEEETDEEPADEGGETDAGDDERPNEVTETESAEAETDVEAVSVAVLVTDDDSEAAADGVVDALAADHEVLGRDRRTDDLESIRSAIRTFLEQPPVDAVVTVGGVAVGPTQVTVDAVRPLLDAELPGFGELFRRRYEQQAGSRALRTRAFAGVAGTTPIFCLPGDADAARAATTDLVAPELDWLVSAASDV